MAITLKGIRVETVNLGRDADSGGTKISSASYSLISSADMVLAKQSIGGYGDTPLEPSPDTIKAMREFVRLYQQDITRVLGLE